MPNAFANSTCTIDAICQIGTLPVDCKLEDFPRIPAHQDLQWYVDPPWPPIPPTEFPPPQPPPSSSSVSVSSSSSSSSSSSTSTSSESSSGTSSSSGTFMFCLYTWISDFSCEGNAWGVPQQDPAYPPLCLTAGEIAAYVLDVWNYEFGGDPCRAGLFRLGAACEVDLDCDTPGDPPGVPADVNRPWHNGCCTLPNSSSSSDSSSSSSSSLGPVICTPCYDKNNVTCCYSDDAKLDFLQEYWQIIYENTDCTGDILLNANPSGESLSGIMSFNKAGCAFTGSLTRKIQVGNEADGAPIWEEQPPLEMSVLTSGFDNCLGKPAVDSEVCAPIGGLGLKVYASSHAMVTGNRCCYDGEACLEGSENPVGDGSCVTPP